MVCSCCSVFVCVELCVARLGKEKKPPYVDSKRSRVYRQPRAHVLPHAGVVPAHTGTFLNVHTGAFWTDTRGREGVKRERREGHRQFCSPKFAHRVITCFREVHRKKPLDLTHSRFENRSKITCSRVLQSFALPDEAVELHFYPEGHAEGISCEIRV